MIEIPDPPTVHACTTCMSALSWLYSARNGQWFAVVRVDDDTMRVHRCKLAGAPTWRTVPKGEPPSEEYLAARAALSGTSDVKKETTAW